MSSGAGAGSRKKIPGAGAAPKQAGSETLAMGVSVEVMEGVREGERRIEEIRMSGGKISRHCPLKQRQHFGFHSMRTLFARMTICHLFRVMIAVFLAKSLRLTPFYGDEVRDLS